MNPPLTTRDLENLRPCEPQAAQRDPKEQKLTARAAAAFGRYCEREGITGEQYADEAWPHFLEGYTAGARSKSA